MYLNTFLLNYSYMFVNDPEFKHQHIKTVSSQANTERATDGITTRASP